MMPPEHYLSWSAFLKVVQTTDDRQVYLADVPDPHAQGEWVVVKIHSAPMCTEYKAYKAGRGLPSMGHEAAGEVVDVDQSSLIRWATGWR